MRSESVFHPNACRVFAGSHKLRFALVVIVCFFSPSGFSFKAAVLCRSCPKFCLCKLVCPFFLSFASASECCNTQFWKYTPL